MTSLETHSVFVVVGGSGGIGSAVARQLQAQGARVAITGRDAERLAAVGKETGAKTFELDARDSAAVEVVLQTIRDSHGRLDGVVNCAGSILLKPAHLISDQEFSVRERQAVERVAELNRAGPRSLDLTLLNEARFVWIQHRFGRRFTEDESGSCRTLDSPTDVEK